MRRVYAHSWYPLLGRSGHAVPEHANKKQRLTLCQWQRASSQCPDNADFPKDPYLSPELHVLSEHQLPCIVEHSSGFFGRVSTSPFAIIEWKLSRLTARMLSYSASPLNKQARVRP